MLKTTTKRRYGVERCDECGTLFRADGAPIDHTWSVVDRTQLDNEGYAREVSNHDTRAEARAEAVKLSLSDDAASGVYQIEMTMKRFVVASVEPDDLGCGDHLWHYGTYFAPDAATAQQKHLARHPGEVVVDCFEEPIELDADPEPDPALANCEE